MFGHCHSSKPPTAMKTRATTAALDEIAIGARWPRLFFHFLLEFQVVIDRRRRRAPFLGDSGMRVVEPRCRLQHRLGEIAVRRGFVRRVRIEHALLRRLRIEHAGLGAVELRPVVRAFCALDVGCRA